jgi:hypothetical protein
MASIAPACPNLAAQWRGVSSEELAELGDEIAVAQACGDVEQRAAVRGHLPGGAAGSMLSSA